MPRGVWRTVRHETWQEAPRWRAACAQRGTWQETYRQLEVERQAEALRNAEDQLHTPSNPNTMRVSSTAEHTT